MRQSYLHIIMYNLECQRDTFQRYTFDLWDRECRHAFLLGARVKLVADTGLGTTSTSTALPRCSSSDPLFSELGQACFCVVVGLFDFTTINNIDDIVDGDRSLSCGQLVTLTRRAANHTSATFVDTMIFQSGIEANTRLCSSFVKFA